ncbi:hypothetical protein BH11BAC2_BH11BAC2_11670 [soil metagenome]
MRNLILILALQIIVFMGCTSSGDKEQKAAVQGSIHNHAFCYYYQENGDTIILHLHVNGEKASGDLLYHLHQKDKNSGAIEGRMAGDTLFADYTFSSEGILSVREVIFLRQGDTFIEGFGEVEDHLGKMVFKNKKAIEFDGKMIFKKGDCN